jgi:RNA polymerase sigma-70 factor (ECF subfamily)
LLIEAFRRGDLGAFETFYRRHEPGVYRTALALTRDSMAADEVVVDTFLRAYRARDTLDTARSPVPWLQRVAINLSVTCLRRFRRRGAPMDVPETIPAGDRHGSPEWCAENGELGRVLVAAIGRLPPHLRSVVVLRFVHGASLAEIAADLDRPLGTVKSRLHEALRRLRADLADELAERRGAGEPVDVLAVAEVRAS